MYVLLVSCQANFFKWESVWFSTESRSALYHQRTSACWSFHRDQSLYISSRSCVISQVRRVSVLNGNNDLENVLVPVMFGCGCLRHHSGLKVAHRAQTISMLWQCATDPPEVTVASYADVYHQRNQPVANVRVGNWRQWPGIKDKVRL